MKRFISIISTILLSLVCLTFVGCDKEEPPKPIVYATDCFNYELVNESYYKVMGLVEGCEEEYVEIPLEYEGLPVKEIAKNSFSATDIKGIKIPEGVATIFANTFESCKKLESIELPSTIKNIGDSAFSGCSNLKSIQIPDGTTNIGKHAFYGCSSLKEVEVPTTVTRIDAGAFYGCNTLRKITLPFVGNRLVYHKFKFFGYIFDATIAANNDMYVPASLKEVVITGGTSIAASAFELCGNIEKISLPETVTEIGSRAFALCNNLKQINIPSSVTKIEGNTFEQCSSLKNLIIPEGVTSIGERAFFFCKELKSIVIPSTVETIGATSFFWCDNMVVYLDLEEVPATWDANWNSSNCPVKFNGEWEFVNGLPKAKK